MKKKFTLLTVGILCVISVATGAIAANLIHEISAELRQDFTIKVDGQVTEFKNVNGEVVYPILYDGTTYLPVRAIGELMGKTVYWYEGDKLIELKDGSTVTDADVIVSDTSGSQTEFIGEEAAKKIALERAGLTGEEVIYTKVRLDNDHGSFHYEVDIRHGNIEYEVDISATDGKIISFEKDLEPKADTATEVQYVDGEAQSRFIGVDAAEEIALKKTGLTREDAPVIKSKLDNERGAWRYEIDIKHNGVEYEIDVSATDGKIIKFEKDLDD